MVSVWQSMFVYAAKGERDQEEQVDKNLETSRGSSGRCTLSAHLVMVFEDPFQITVLSSEDTQYKPAKQLPVLKKEGICLPFIHIQTLPVSTQPFLSGTSPPFSSQEEGQTSYFSPFEAELSFPLLLMSS